MALGGSALMVLERAAPKVAGSTAFDPPGRAKGDDGQTGGLRVPARRAELLSQLRAHLRWKARHTRGALDKIRPYKGQRT